MSRYTRAKRFLTRCPMCGSPTHRFYLGETPEDFICFNCHRMFVQKERLHPTIVEKKSLQVQQFQKESNFIGMFISHFIVGFGYVWWENFLRGLKLFAVAESLGGAASLAELPATMSHASMPAEFRKKVGISDRLVRLSVGLENKADLIADLKSGLKFAGKE